MTAAGPRRSHFVGRAASVRRDVGASRNRCTVVASMSRPGRWCGCGSNNCRWVGPPRIEYIDWTAVVDTDGTRTELEKGPPEGNEQEGRTYWAFGRFGSGWLTETDSFGSTLVVHAFDGSKAPSSGGGGSIVATSSDGQRVLMGYPPAVLGPGRTDVGHVAREGLQPHGRGRLSRSARCRLQRPTHGVSGSPRRVLRRAAGRGVRGGDLTDQGLGDRLPAGSRP